MAFPELRPARFPIAIFPIAMALSSCGRVVAQAQAQPRAEANPPAGLVPDSMKWVENPAIPRGGVITILAGKLTAPAPYAFRVRLPPDYRVMPHTHPDDRLYTVIEGTWSIGLGETLDTTKLREYPVGSVYFLPANTPHFHWSRSPSVAQINAVGPTATVYVNPADDPRRK